MKITLRRLFDLRRDQNENEAIDLAIRADVRVGGTNLWVLIFAILIASVGLNVNSTAVVIGAMLISPLMGPLLGIGYGAGINDFRLIQNAARSLGIFVAISLVTSTLYFLLTPLSQAQTEILARTTPSLWDVLIAFFGGCAGIVAQTRKDESNIIPGVAIATALMPPLCTAGYGLATANWEYFFGAFYLFTINAFFIAFATLMFVKLLRLPQHEEADPRIQHRARLIIATGIVAMLVPSAFLTYRLVEEQLFLSSAKALVADIEKRPGVILLTKEISSKEKQISLTFGGTPLPAEFKQQLEAQLHKDGFDNVSLSLRHLGSDKVDVVSLKNELQKDVYAHTLGQLNDSNAKISALTLQIAKLEATKPQRAQLIQEIMAQYPALTRIAVAEGEESARINAKSSPALVVALEASPLLPDADVQRLNAWMSAKFPDHVIHIVQAPGKIAEKAAAAQPVKRRVKQTVSSKSS